MGDCGPMIFSGDTALYLDFSARSFPDNSSNNFDPVKLYLCKTVMWSSSYYLEVTLR